MARLTIWNGKKWVLPQGRTSDGESNWRRIAERLAAYENTGLEPEECAAERAKGSWIPFETYGGMLRRECSECGFKTFNHFRFCPECGADMRGEKL